MIFLTQKTNAYLKLLDLTDTFTVILLFFVLMKHVYGVLKKTKLDLNISNKSTE